MSPENIFIDSQGNAVLGDLGAVSLGLAANTVIGNRPYWAPEILKAGCDDSPYSNKVDVWSLGLVFAEMLTGSKP